MTTTSAASVLLVDDELHILRAAEFKLKKSGFDVSCASDGEEAWERIRERRPDIVVTDLQMPRLNGRELIARIRAHAETESMPVILLTAKGYELSHQETYGEHGIFKLMAKPFSPRELCNLVQQATEGARQNEELSGTHAG